jgi:hypothetical protein
MCFARLRFHEDQLAHLPHNAILDLKVNLRTKLPVKRRELYAPPSRTTSRKWINLCVLGTASHIVEFAQQPFRPAPGDLLVEAA